MVRGLLLLALWLAVGLTGAAAAERADPRDECAARLQTLGRACLLYAEDNGGRMPSSLAELYYRAYVNDLALFSCPGAPVEILSREEIVQKAGYVLSTRSAAAGRRPIVEDRSPDNHGRSGINVWYSDGSVRWEPVGEVSPKPDGGQVAMPLVKVVATKPLPPLGVTLVPGAKVTQVTLCLGLNTAGEPIQPGLRFPSTARKLACRVVYEGVPANTDLMIEWYHGSSLKSRQLAVIDGAGSIVSYAYTSRGEPFSPGRYSIEISLGEEKQASAHFEVEASAVPPAR